VKPGQQAELAEQVAQEQQAAPVVREHKDFKALLVRQGQQEAPEEQVQLAAQEEPVQPAEQVALVL
jgi:hypothetical protein